MRCCTALWGGRYNPIIPIFRSPPKHWKPEPFERFTGQDIAKGYVRFFEPDVFVEAEQGLAERAGLAKLREKHAIHPHVISLKDFLYQSNHRSWSEPAFGLNIRDVLEHIYKTEQRFQARDEKSSLLVKPDRNSATVEAVFGVYPTQKHAAYIGEAYKTAFKPSETSSGPEAWLKTYKDGAATPLRVTEYGLDLRRYWHHEPVIFVFDPTNVGDLIDLWNMRLEPQPILPVPAPWFEKLSEFISHVVKSQHRPIQGNPQGLMHHTTIEVARSISKEAAEKLLKFLQPDIPSGALRLKLWRTRIWAEHGDDHVYRDQRMEVTADEQRATLRVKDEKELTTTFATLAPPFARRYGGVDHRWANAFRISAFGVKNIATVLPFNQFDPSWPPLGMGGDRVLVGTEGWIFAQRHKGWDQYVHLLTPENAIIGSLRGAGFEAALSEPGHIAKQMIEHLGGMWGAHLLADLGTLQLLNKMAGGVRRRTNELETIEETFELRTAPIKDWADLISRRQQQQTGPGVQLADFTSKNVIRLGLESVCPHCQARNWSSLTAVDYRVICDRCLNPYDFPQASLREQNKNWFYRVVGPFSVPDYGRGAYSVILALRVLQSSASSMGEMTFSTAMNLKFDGKEAEVDFIAWQREEDYDRGEPPQLIIGEAKSFGQGDLIKPRDLSQLRAVATKLPGAAVVIAVLRDHFLETEKQILKSFVTWAQRLNSFGEPTNPVLLLTANELFMDHHVSWTWKALGEPHAKFVGFETTRNIRTLANATQQIYLGMPSFHAWRDQQLRKRRR